MAKYFGIYANSADVQTALVESAISKPYVAIVSGELDYNTVVPITPKKGTWTLVGQGLYWFDVNPEADWSDETLVAVVPDAWYDSVEHQDVSIRLLKEDDNWIVKFDVPDASEADEYVFTEGGERAYTTSHLEIGEGSDRTPVDFTWDGLYQFTFVAHDTTAASLEMNTIDPPYSA